MLALIRHSTRYRAELSVNTESFTEMRIYLIIEVSGGLIFQRQVNFISHQSWQHKDSLVSRILGPKSLLITITTNAIIAENSSSGRQETWGRVAELSLYIGVQPWMGEMSLQI